MRKTTIRESPDPWRLFFAGIAVGLFLAAMIVGGVSLGA